MAEQQKKELQSLFDEDDILRAQGQGNVADHTEEVTERLQERLDERDRIDEDNEESIKEETIEEILSKKEQLEKEED